MSFGRPFRNSGFRPQRFRGGRPWGRFPRQRGGFNQIGPPMYQPQDGPNWCEESGTDYDNFSPNYSDGMQMEEQFPQQQVGNFQPDNILNMPPSLEPGDNENVPNPGLTPSFHPGAVMTWLDHQNPFVIQRIHYHTKWLLDQMGINLNDEHAEQLQVDNPENQRKNVPAKKKRKKSSTQSTSGWYNEQASNAPKPSGSNQQPQNAKKSKHPGFGWKQNQLQWTPAGWALKDNSHKVTTKMKPLPTPDVIPDQSSTYPDASADKEKMKMLKNNLKIMQFELTKICKKFGIANLNKDDLSIYPEDQRSRLEVALNCVSNAEKTMEDFREFLVDDKYKDWNEEQKKKRDEQVKEMIGEMPSGVPHKRPNSSHEEGEPISESNG